MKQKDVLEKLEKLTRPRMLCEEDVIHAGNFAKLAIYLNETKIPPEKFCMSWIISSNSDAVDSSDWEPKDVKKALNICGTSACALGHAPMAGINPRRGMIWSDYDKCFFVNSDCDEWFHCFDASWEGGPKDAAKRIAYMLLTGRISTDMTAMDRFSKALKDWRPRWSVIREHVNDKAPWTLHLCRHDGWYVKLKEKKGIIILPPLLLSSPSAGTRS